MSSLNQIIIKVLLSPKAYIPRASHEVGIEEPQEAFGFLEQ